MGSGVDANLRANGVRAFYGLIVVVWCHGLYCIELYCIEIANFMHPKKERWIEIATCYVSIFGSRKQIN